MLHLKEGRMLCALVCIWFSAYCLTFYNYLQEDLWLSAFPIGTEWENIDKIKEFNWNFENLEKALEEGGEAVWEYGLCIWQH
ncbi:unnamed protein product [Triticum turgidum subsp. durum]|uniref:Uncharacterized protein n=1 Tax=Triticum turgidum subsp. durum TaxID=4567 RepID=A0A9R0X502_TRITD|nr:unnamed protein product [Triticum turgidum subsp. durum]